MAGGCVNRFCMARGGSIAATIVRSAEVGAALDYFARNFNIGPTGIVTCGFGATPRIFGDATCFSCIGLMLLGVPVDRPFPDIADHVVNAVSIGRECSHWRRAFE